MSIPSTQIDIWSKQGPIASSSTTYQSIRNALTDAQSPIAGMIASKKIRIDLQGSYAHDTNIRGDSDVDVIIHYVDTFHSNKTSLPADQFLLHEQCYSSASYTWDKLRNDVIKTLSKYYGSENVDTTGNKSLKVLPNSGRLRADIVPVVSYRKYNHFYGAHDHSREDGVTFYHRATGQHIINYPDQHYANAVAKHLTTNDNYKRIVRIFKNMRSCLVDKGRLTKTEAPSYFLQGMIYNVPNELFTNDKKIDVLEILRWLQRIDMKKLKSQNEQHLLLGSTDEYWHPAFAKKTVSELCYLWDNWGNI